MSRQRLPSLYDGINKGISRCRSHRASASTRRLAQRTTLCVLVIVGLSGLACRSAMAQITLHADFESASLDLLNSNVNGNIVTLFGNASYTAVLWLGPVYQLSVISC